MNSRRSFLLKAGAATVSIAGAASASLAGANIFTPSAGNVDCNLYKQPGRLILHITNLTSTGTWRKPIDELIPIGPLSVRVKLSNNAKGEYLNLLAAGQKMPAIVRDGWSHFRISSILDHEVIVIF